MGEDQNDRGRVQLDAGSGFVDVGWMSEDGVTFAIETEPEPGRSFATSETVTVRATMRVPAGTYRLPPTPLLVSPVVAAGLPPELLESGLVRVHPGMEMHHPPVVDLRRAGEEARQRIALDTIPPHLLSRYLT